MHIFVEYGQKHEVGIAIAEIHDAVADFLHITNRLSARRQRQMPARIVCNLRRIIEGITVRAHRRMTSCMTQHPVFLKIGNVSDLPQKGIDRAQYRNTKLIVREIAYEIERARSSINNQGF